MSHFYRASEHRSGSVTHYVVAYQNQEAWIHAAASDFVRLGVTAVRDRGAFHVVLPGGSTPRKVLHKLSPELIPAELCDAGQQPTEVFEAWLRATHVYFGDERGVPPTDENSNYRMVEEAWLSRAPIPASQVHRMEGELDLIEAADRYNKGLFGLLGPERRERAASESATSTGGSEVGGASARGAEAGAFDLVALGIGPDGHTASLIPGTPLEYIAEPWAGVGPAPMSPAKVRRITLTPAALAATRATRFWVSGEGKAEVVHAAVTGTGMETIIPKVIKAGGEAVWIIDSEARSKLDEA